MVEAGALCFSDSNERIFETLRGKQEEVLLAFVLEAVNELRGSAALASGCSASLGSSGCLQFKNEKKAPWKCWKPEGSAKAPWAGAAVPNSHPRAARALPAPTAPPARGQGLSPRVGEHRDGGSAPEHRILPEPERARAPPPLAARVGGAALACPRWVPACNGQLCGYLPATGSCLQRPRRQGLGWSLPVSTGHARGAGSPGAARGFHLSF